VFFVLKESGRMIGRRFTGAILIGLVLSPLAQAGPFSKIVLFGDSLSDTGNADIRFFGLVPGSGYFDGRFSNGPVWIEQLAEQLQLPVPTPSLDSPAGFNYAFGGAETNDSGFFILDINEQVSDYLNNDGGPIGDELFVIWGGANDLLGGQTNMAVPVNNLAGQISNLYAAGARRFMVPNLPLLGKTPRFVGTTDEPVFDARTQMFNDQLNLSLDSLEGTLADVEFFRIDAASLIESATLNPGTFGFTNVTDEAMGLGGIDPDEYLFWDDVHPTTAGHSLLGLEAAGVLFDSLGVLAGDLDLNGFVGVDDLNIVLNNWNNTVTPGNPLLGDSTDDGFVGVDDLNLVLANWKNGTPPDLAANIPEPGTLAVLLFMGLATIRRGK
jgi:phospholipase/lecithinase/hemolysin